MILCVLFLAVGVAVVDDYGLSLDEAGQRKIAADTLDFVLERRSFEDSRNVWSRHKKPNDRYYGMAFELPLLLVERALGLADSRDVHLSRHILTHAFFLFGGFCCWLLARRLFQSRLLATFAMLFFLLHPRLYAHSFFNSRDIPFASMFMVALLLTHWAFARGAPRAFLACGAGVGVLVNLRVMGLTLFAAVLAMQALDFMRASSREERKRILQAGGAFVLAAALTLYAASPYLWVDPTAFFVSIATLAKHPNGAIELFQGEFIDGRDLPMSYLPVWFSISTPPAVLLLGLAGAAWILRQGAARPAEALRNGPLRFALLLGACFAAPIAAVALLGSTLYHDWRHLYFIHAPFSLLATFGLHWLASTPRSARLRAGAYGLAALGLGAAAASMVAIHPYQHLYFNFLVDRTTPERLRSQYQMDYWGTAVRDGLEHLLARYPSSPIHVDGSYGNIVRSAALLPEAERRRISNDPAPNGFHSFYISGDPRRQMHGNLTLGSFAPSLYNRRIFNNTILTVAAVDLNLVGEAVAADYRKILSTVEEGEAVVDANFQLYLHGGNLIYVKKACKPEDVKYLFFLRVTPLSAEVLPAWGQPRDFEQMYFRFVRHGVIFDGVCLASVPLPNYGIARISAGQTSREDIRWAQWRAEFVPTYAFAGRDGL